MKLVVIDLEGNEISKKTLNVPVISEKNINEHLIHDVHLYHRHRKHTGNHSVKGRSAVSGGGAKPYRQKGGGRARRGTNRSPLRRGGGVIFVVVMRAGRPGHDSTYTKSSRKQNLHGRN